MELEGFGCKKLARERWETRCWKGMNGVYLEEEEERGGGEIKGQLAMFAFSRLTYYFRW